MSSFKPTQPDSAGLADPAGRPDFGGKTVALVITGSIAAYKGAEIARELIKHQARVIPILSRGGRQFITPLTLQALTGNRVLTDLFDLESEREIGHIAAADAADLILIAPATADILAKSAAGSADDIATAVILASNAPLVFAPAMNVQMWENAATQENVRRLIERGAVIAAPAEGELACGWFGSGRLADVAEIVKQAAAVLAAAPMRKRRSDTKTAAAHRVKDLSGVDLIITAGPTREPIDPVRFISNRSSGKMGFALAERAGDRGARVVLISGPTGLEPPAGVEFEQVGTAREMLAAVLAAVSAAIESSGAEGAAAAAGGERPVGVIMAAAVTDHRPACAAELKLHPDKAAEYDLRLVPNPDILTELFEMRRRLRESGQARALRIVGFSVDNGERSRLLEIAAAKLNKRQIDAIVANEVAAFENDSNQVWFLKRDGAAVEVQAGSKTVVADGIIDNLLGLW